MNQYGQTEQEFLKQYNPSMYERPSVTVDMLIFTIDILEERNYRKLPEKELKILLVKRKDHPCIGQWALPGGFVNMDENLEGAAARELFEETGLKDVYMEQLYTWGDVDRDPRTRIISTSYMALVSPESIEINAGDDAEDARLFSIKTSIVGEETKQYSGSYQNEKHVKLELTNNDIKLSTVVRYKKTVKGKRTNETVDILESNNIAFDHARIIQYGLDRLKNKISYTDIAFNLMPELFTLTELKQIYEIILNEKLLSANFRRKIAPMVIATDKTKIDFGHRPAALYKLNPEWDMERGSL